MVEQAAIVVAAIIERQIFFKTDCPSTVELAPLRAVGLKSVEKWQKSAANDHAMLQSVTFVIESQLIRQARQEGKVEKD
jgi:hypothetical protein